MRNEQAEIQRKKPNNTQQCVYIDCTIMRHNEEKRTIEYAFLLFEFVLCRID